MMSCLPCVRACVRVRVRVRVRACVHACVYVCVSALTTSGPRRPQVIFYYILLARRLLERANAAAVAGKGLLNAL
jgi:hypothetical protein